MCLFELASWYEFKKIKCHDDCPMLKNGFGYLHKRNKKKILKIPNINYKDKDATEKLYFQKLMLFKPWKNEATDIKEKHPSYSTAFDNFETSTMTSELIQIFEHNKSRMTNTLNEIKLAKTDLPKNDSDEIIETETFEPSLGCADYNITEIDGKSLDEKILALNSDQRILYDKVNNSINQTDMDNSNKTRIFCSGVAGKYLKR